MGNRTAKFVSALVGSIIAGAPLAAVSQNAPAATSTANAVGDCLASPKGSAPQGQHWYYRLERATKRQCWYLRAEADKDNVKPAQAAIAAPATVAPAPPQSVQNARAEYVAPQAGSAASAPSAPAAASDNTMPPPAVATRWPDAAAAPAPEAAAPPPQAAAQPAAKPAKSPAAVTLAAAEMSADRPTGSLPTLLLVIVGALALAGLIASVIYRFAGGRVRVQASDHRRVNWDNREPRNADDHAPWLTAAPAAAPRPRQPRPIDFDAARPQATRLTAFTSEIGRIAAQSRPAPVAPSAPDEPEIETFDGEFELEAAAPQLAAGDAAAETTVDRNEDARAQDEEDAVDIDVITAMLERLAQDGPRLTVPGAFSNEVETGSREEDAWGQDSTAPFRFHRNGNGPSPEADLADFARSPRGQSAARA